MLLEDRDTYIDVDEGALIKDFAAWVKTVDRLPDASRALQAIILEEIKTIAEQINVSSETGSASAYGRRVLYEEEGLWSLAAIILRPGQETLPHDHGSWGCAATVQGCERDRRFTQDASGELLLRGEYDYPPGTGYIFDAQDIHQPFGADPEMVTVALHFLVLDCHPHEAMRES
jgi:predicted metal-dependent enzyme (double-stranded beta helix superfamily)